MSLRLLLLPFSLLYNSGVILRNWFFDIGLLPIRKALVPVISVGNISAGGVGKTPLVEFLARKLGTNNKVAVISRGYGRKSKGYLVASNGRQRCAEAWKAGDEASQLAEKLDGTVVLVDEKRTRAADHAVRDFQASVLLLDDGFQHRYLHRDLNIVVLGLEDLVKRDFPLPAGNRRETLSALQRADVIGISRCENKEGYEKARTILLRIIDKPMFAFRTRVKAIRSGVTKKEVKVERRKPIAFSGIGEPSAFSETLKSIGIRVVDHVVFRDHHWYSASDIDRIQNLFRSHQSDAILTTEKDISRLSGDNTFGQKFLEEYPVYYVEIEPEIISGNEVLEEKLKSVVHAYRHN
ncbi:MAG: tetraacyldisaccharide 4'-kinase [Ignavibacteriales bacterium]|nr:tetraacyldisaccharide 4'-kinase [Ignavibacteriales bacterium]